MVGEDGAAWIPDLRPAKLLSSPALRCVSCSGGTSAEWLCPGAKVIVDCTPLEDLAEIAVICELRQRGFSLQRVRKVMAFLQRELGKRLYESASTNSQIHLLTDGKNIFIKDSPESIVDVLKNSRQPILAVCLSDTVQRVQAGIRVGSRSGRRRETDGREACRATGRSGKRFGSRQSKAGARIRRVKRDRRSGQQTVRGRSGILSDIEGRNGGSNGRGNRYPE